MHSNTLDTEDTIAAISTPVGDAGIGIVRISGEDALKIADKIFVSKEGKNPSEFKTYTTHYGWIVANQKSQIRSQESQATGICRYEIPDLGQEIIDEVILTVMRAPKSYTKEDIVEINCHSGPVALRRVLELVLENGCRLASPGEFTKRAFLNGRIDLPQAEAVLDIIRAKTDSALRVSLQQLKGALSSSINKVRDLLLDVLSVLEANIDFPEEQIRELDIADTLRKLTFIGDKLKSILGGANYGRVLREGIHTVICGKPNVGKSSLLNALLKSERSIVTPVAGTTRDTIEEIINIKGIPARIVDTAGIIEPRDLVERKAVARSRRYIESADLVILLFDGSQRLDRQDKFLIKKLRKKTVIAVINKIDLKQKISRGALMAAFKQVIDISAKRLKNIEALENSIAQLVYDGRVRVSEPVLVSNQRHIDALKKADKLVAAALDSLHNKLPLEFVAQDIRDALDYLDDILGGRFSEDLLDKIFSDFCIGK